MRRIGLVLALACLAAAGFFDLRRMHANIATRVAELETELRARDATVPSTGSTQNDAATSIAPSNEDRR